MERVSANIMGEWVKKCYFMSEINNSKKSGKLPPNRKKINETKRFFTALLYCSFFPENIYKLTLNFQRYCYTLRKNRFLGNRMFGKK